MTPLAILVKVSALLGVAAVAHALVGRRMSAAMRHQLWTLTAISLAAPPGRHVCASRLDGDPHGRCGAGRLPVDRRIVRSDADSGRGSSMIASRRCIADDGAASSRTRIPGSRGRPHSPRFTSWRAGPSRTPRRPQARATPSPASSRATETGTEWKSLLAECAQRLGVRHHVRLASQPRSDDARWRFGFVNAGDR